MLTVCVYETKFHPPIVSMDIFLFSPEWRSMKALTCSKWTSNEVWSAQGSWKDVRQRINLSSNVLLYFSSPFVQRVLLTEFFINLLPDWLSFLLRFYDPFWTYLHTLTHIYAWLCKWTHMSHKNAYDHRLLPWALSELNALCFHFSVT